MSNESNGHDASRRTLAYYEQYAEYWHATHRDDNLWHRGLMKAMSGLPKGARILDAGCGTGNIARVLRASGFWVTGLDTSAKMLAIAREEIPGVRFVLGSILEPAVVLADAWYEVVVAYGVMHHLSPSECELAIERLTERLTPGGRLFIGVRSTVCTAPQPSATGPDPRFFRQYTIDEMAQMLASTGRFASRECSLIPEKEGRWYVEALATVAI